MRPETSDQRTGAVIGMNSCKSSILRAASANNAARWAAIGAVRAASISGSASAAHIGATAQRNWRTNQAGEVDGATKRDLLARADALLFPIEWDEPFGLVMVEALASGTPVIGFRRASVPEVVDDGRTGFVVDDIDGMVEAIGRIGALDRGACRAAAEERFTVSRMVDDVEAMYRAVLAEVNASTP